MQDRKNWQNIKNSQKKNKNQEDEKEKKKAEEEAKDKDEGKPKRLKASEDFQLYEALLLLKGLSIMKYKS